MMRKTMVLVASVALATWVAACKIHVDKDANGNEKTVQVDTPFGGVHVNTDQTTAADLGLPVYPGADIVKDDDQHKSADVHMGFGEWQLRVRAVTYSTPDSQDKVTAFYKKALARYGDVITCNGHTPVGTPTTTTEGLTCEGDKTQVDVNGKKNGLREGGLELKAGSQRHQHIVGFDDPKNGQTRFALVALDLPAAAASKGDKSD